MTITKILYENCEKCPHVNDCDEKRMCACGMMELPKKISDSMSAALTMPIAAEMLVKHDYRNIKIGPTQTITIDLEEMKKAIRQRLHESLGYPGLECGA